jgi:hypothetical protein
MPLVGAMPLVPLGTKMRAKPSLAASAMRCSVRVTGLISPVKPTSPAKHTSIGTAISALLLSTAHTTARSIAGSSTRKPPARFRNTSFCPSRKPQRFSITASNMFKRRRSKPVELRCGVPYTAVLTKACTSINKGRMPSMVAATTTPLGRSSRRPSSTWLGSSTSASPLPCIS